MRSTIIPDIGDYSTKFKVGDEQELSFKESEPGPFWLNEEEKFNTKFDTEEGPI